MSLNNLGWFVREVGLCVVEVVDSLAEVLSLPFGRKIRYVVFEIGDGLPLDLTKISTHDDEIGAVRDVKAYTGDKLLMVAVRKSDGQIVTMDGSSFINLWDKLKLAIDAKKGMNL